LTAEAYPLQWPEGWPRTRNPKRARFETSMAKARDELFEELRRMGAKDIVLSTNLAVRNDGLPRAKQREPEDSSAAVYWRDAQGEARCIACDRWLFVRDNIRALGLTIAALRGLDRWGSSEIVSRAFTGFQRLEARGDDWRTVLGVSRNPTLDEARAAMQRLRAKHHPDRGGDPDTFRRVTHAWHAAQVELVQTGGA